MRWERVLESAAVFHSIWVEVGPLVGVVLGVLLGAYLTMRAQRQHWILDSKKEEYRELLSTLSQSMNAILDLHTPMIAHGPEEQRAEHDSQLKALAVIGDRLFISDEVKKIDVLNRWCKAVREIETGGHSGAFARTVKGILADITDSAKKIVA